MDQVLGVPRMNDRDRAKHTINARLTRLEEQVNTVNTKLDECINMLMMIPEIKRQVIADSTDVTDNHQFALGYTQNI